MSREATAFSLLDALSETGFQSSVIATYSCYFPFYEEVVLRRLLDRGCTNNILMVDASRCAEAFANEDTRPRRSGRDYTLIPVSLQGAFHPKLIVTVGKSKGALFVGSHNMTLAGFGLNDEVTNAFRVSGAGARQAGGPIRTALDYLQGFAPVELEDVRQVFAGVRRNVPWLEGPVAVESNDRVFLTTNGSDSDLWSRVRPLVPKGSTEAFICGPFFDSKLTFLRRLVDDVKPRKLVVGIDPESVEIDGGAVRKFRDAEFVNIGGLPRVPGRRESGVRYLHAKVLWFKGSDGELLVTGSANPSQAAFLSSTDRRNAEAIVTDRRKGAADALGLRELAEAPDVTGADWARVAERQDERTEASQSTRGTLVLAVPAHDGLRLERAIGGRVALEAFAADGTAVGEVTTGGPDPLLIQASEAVRDAAHVLRGVTAAKQPIVVLVHRPDDIARNIGGDRQRDLRLALGSLEEHPTRLESLLKLTEKVIFDSDDVVAAGPLARPRSSNGRNETPEAGPESLAVEAAGRRATRKKRQLASGDVLVLLDALMRRLGDGHSAPSAARPPDEEVRPPAEDDAGDEQPPHEPVPLKELAELCRGKVGRLIRRMSKQLDAAEGEGTAGRAVVQLAAVLSVVHTLRIMEQRTEWRSQRLKLVDPDHQWQLLEAGGLALAWSQDSLTPRALLEGQGEWFQELSLAIGLLTWLAWDTEIDVVAELGRTSQRDLNEEDDPWYPIQVFASLSRWLAADAEAEGILGPAVERTPRKGSDGAAWVARHLRLAVQLAALQAEPDSGVPLGRHARAGDLVVLGQAVEPRVRVVLGVVPSGSTDKVKVFDLANDARERQFLVTHVKCVSWGELGVAETSPDRRTGRGA